MRQATSTIGLTLQTLFGQRHDSFEIVAAVETGDPTATLLRREPRVRLIECARRAGVPQLRRDAVFAARGELLALAEDHCEYPADWLTTLERGLEDGAAASGGAVANGRHTYVGWAQYFTRYAAFLPPGEPGLTTHLPGNNACYRTTDLLSRRDRLRDGFWEAEFNDSLRSEGLRLVQTGAIARQRQHRECREYFVLRYRHGRCYGGRRMEAAGPGEPSRLWLRAPLIPAVLFLRTVRAAAPAPAFLVTSPLVLAYQLAWAAGELVGYAAGPGKTTTETD